MRKPVLIAFVFACMLPVLQAKADLLQLSKCVETNVARLAKEKNKEKTCDLYKNALACNAQLIAGINHSLATGEFSETDKWRATLRNASEENEIMQALGSVAGCKL